VIAACVPPEAVACRYGGDEFALLLEACSEQEAIATVRRMLTALAKPILDLSSVPTRLLTAISLGSVMMGAMTYIGNGPNFMVKTIAQQAGVQMPSFFGYLRYSFAILLPIIGLDCWLFL
jgi:Na+/H+ antiporter NhaD/arsenite permease-like protein